MSDPNKPNMPNLNENSRANVVAIKEQSPLQPKALLKQSPKNTGQRRVNKQHGKNNQLIDTSNQAIENNTGQLQASMPIIATADVERKKLPNERWKEILRYEINFFVDIEIFLKLAPILLEHLPSSCHSQWKNLCDAYKSFDKSKSLLFQISQQPENHVLSESNYIKLIKLLTDSICKDHNYWDRIAEACSKIIQKHEEYNQLINDYKNKLLHLNLDKILPTNVRLKLVEDYPTIINGNYLNRKLPDFLDKIIILPIQYVTKIPLLLEDLRNDFKNYPAIADELTRIQQRIAIAAKGANSIKTASDYGTEARFSTVVSERQASTLQHLPIGIAYIFQVVDFYMQVETNKNTETECRVLELLNDTRRIFINITRTPGAIGILIEKLQQILNFPLSYEMRELIRHCLTLLEGDLDAINRIYAFFNDKLEDTKKVTTAKEAYLYNYHSIITLVIKEVESIITGINTEKTLAPVKTVGQFFFRMLSSEQESGLILIGLRLKSFKGKLEKLLAANYDQLNNLINSMQLPFQRNIVNLIAYLYAECSQFCNKKISYMAIESIESLMMLLKMTQSFQKDTQQAITDAYLKVNSFEDKLRSDDKNVSRKSNILFLINILIVLNEYYKYKDNKGESAVLFVKEMVFKFCFQLKRDPQVNLPLNELKLAIQKLKDYVSSNNLWVMETLINLSEGQLVAGAGAPIGLLVNNISQQNELHYLYKCIIQQCSVFFVNYMQSINNSFIKKRTTATAKQRYVDYCCEQLNDELYHLKLKELKLLISQVSEPYPKSIIGLLESKFITWESSFDDKRLNSIATKGELLKAIEDLHRFFTELKPIISPKPTSLEVASPTLSPK